MATALEAPEHWRAVIRIFLADHLRRSGAEGFVVGVSGGVDSSVTAALCVDAVGADRVLGVLMPHRDSDPADARDGRVLCEHLGIEHVERDITSLVDAVAQVVPDLDAHGVGNVKARARMLVLYAEAYRRGRLVSGTGNKSELLVGYFTKHGDGAADVEPLGDLYKTQVLRLAEHLGLPDVLATRPPSAGLVPGQTDEADLGLPYEALDAVLKCIELNTPDDAIPGRTGESPERVAHVVALVRQSEHKRHMPLVPKIGARTVGIDWRRSVHWDA